MEKITRLSEYVFGYLNGVWTEADLLFAFKINTDRGEDAEEIAKKAVNAALVSPVMLRRILFSEVMV